MGGVRAAGTVLAINLDPDALVFDAADIGIVAIGTMQSLRSSANSSGGVKSSL